MTALLTYLMEDERETKERENACNLKKGRRETAWNSRKGRERDHLELVVRHLELNRDLPNKKSRLAAHYCLP